MNQSHPGATPERPGDIPGGEIERIATPDSEVQAQGAAQSAAAAAVREAGDTAESELQAMTEHVMDKADLEAGTCFGIPVPDNMLPVEVARLLCQLKAEKGLPIETLPDAMVGPLLKVKITELAEVEVSNRKVETTDRYAEWRERFATNSEAILAADTLDTGGNEKLEAVKQRLLAFRRILVIAKRNETDAEIVTARLAQVDLSDPLEPVTFVRAFLFDSPSQPSGISEATQTAIAEELGIKRPDLDVDTGSEMTDVFEKGVGTRQVRDPETSEIRDEPVYLQPGEFAAIRDGQSLGLTDQGERAMRFEEENGDFTVLLPDNAGPEDMVQYGLAGQMMTALHEMNMVQVFYPGRSDFELGGGVLPIRQPGDFNRTQKLCQIFFDNFTGFDGELLAQSDIDKIPYLMQFHSRRGDHVIGDVNPEQTKADYRAQGVIDKDGNLDLNRFEELVAANRAQLFTEANFARQAQDKAG